MMKPKKTLSEQQSAMQKRLARNQQQSYLRKREQRLIYARAHNLEVKAEVLTHYGWDGTLRCCWDGCSVNDVDMLTLDHTADDGAQKRASGEGNGQGLYKKLRKLNFPAGYQTLCANHQLKKEVERRRSKAASAHA